MSWLLVPHRVPTQWHDLSLFEVALLTIHLVKIHDDSQNNFNNVVQNHMKSYKYQLEGLPNFLNYFLSQTIIHWYRIM